MTPRPYRLGRRQAAVDRTRARILTAARALLVARGNTDFSIEAVARRARVTRATVYQRFGARPKLPEALFDDLALRGGVRGPGAALRRPGPREAPARFISPLRRFWTAHRGVPPRLLAPGGARP